MNVQALLSNKDFESRYGIAKSNVYNRLNGLREKGYPVDPIKQGNRSLYTLEQAAIMDQLHQHLLAGWDIASFPNADGRSPIERPIERPIDQQDAREDAGVLALNSESLVDAIAGRLAEVITVTQSRQLLPAAPADPLANLRVIEEAHTNGWHLSTSQLAPLLGVKSLAGKEVHRYGYKFTREGKNGAESAWRIERS